MNLLKAARLFLGSTFHYTLTEIISGSLLIVTRPLFGGGRGRAWDYNTQFGGYNLMCAIVYILAEHEHVLVPNQWFKPGGTECHRVRGGYTIETYTRRKRKVKLWLSSYAIIAWSIEQTSTASTMHQGPFHYLSHPSLAGMGSHSTVAVLSHWLVAHGPTESGYGGPCACMYVRYSDIWGLYEVGMVGLSTI